MLETKNLNQKKRNISYATFSNIFLLRPTGTGSQSSADAKVLLHIQISKSFSIQRQNFGVGATVYSRNAILRAFILKHLEQIKSVPLLIRYLGSIPPLAEMCGFDFGVLPDESQFYRFLKDTNNSTLKAIQETANDLLIEKCVISLDEFIIDSKPIQATTKENNFKNPSRNTTNKAKRPKRNTRATLSYYSSKIIGGKKQNIIFFWGFRTHALVTKEGICLIEKTLPNNYTDQEVAFSLIKDLKRKYKFNKGAMFLADKAYDVRELYTFIVEKMKSTAYILSIQEIPEETKHLAFMAVRYVMPESRGVLPAHGLKVIAIGSSFTVH